MADDVKKTEEQLADEAAKKEEAGESTASEAAKPEGADAPADAE